MVASGEARAARSSTRWPAASSGPGPTGRDVASAPRHRRSPRPGRGGLLGVLLPLRGAGEGATRPRASSRPTRGFGRVGRHRAPDSLPAGWPGPLSTLGRRQGAVARPGGAGPRRGGRPTSVTLVGGGGPSSAASRARAARARARSRPAVSSIPRPAVMMSSTAWASSRMRTSCSGSTAHRWPHGWRRGGC